MGIRTQMQNGTNRRKMANFFSEEQTGKRMRIKAERICKGKSPQKNIENF